MIPSSAQSLIIECPHCATRYQLAPEALGPRGRNVQCANCGEAWRANPPPPVVSRPLIKTIEALVDEATERLLDDALATEERSQPADSSPAARRWAEEARDAERSLADIRAALGPRARPVPSATPVTAQQRSQSKALSVRIAELNRHLPSARLRRSVRTGAVVLLLGLLTTLALARVQIVTHAPQMAGLYAALGLPVNIIGLEFRDVTTVLSRQDGAQLLRITARIVSVAGRPVPVPAVIVSLLGADRAVLYRWSVAPSARDLGAGEYVNFTSQITTPPPGVTGVRLTFADGRSGTEAQAKTPTDTTGERG